MHTLNAQMVAKPHGHKGDGKYNGAIPRPHKKKQKKQPQMVIELNAGTIKMHQQVEEPRRGRGCKSKVSASHNPV